MAQALKEIESERESYSNSQNISYHILKHSPLFSNKICSLYIIDDNTYLFDQSITHYPNYASAVMVCIEVIPVRII